jgi:hypothetical protein
MINFDYYEPILYILDEKYIIFRVNLRDYTMHYINSNSYFKNKISNTKSANNLYQSE